MSSHRWTEADDAYIRRHFNRDSVVEMAKFFDVKLNAFRNHTWLMGLRRFEKPVGEIVPPRRMDVMHSVYHTPAWVCPREGAGDAALLPSRRGDQAVYHDRGHA